MQFLAGGQLRSVKLNQFIQQAEFSYSIVTRKCLFFIKTCIETHRKVFLTSVKPDIKDDKPLISKLFFKALGMGLSGSYTHSFL